MNRFAVLFLLLAAPWCGRAQITLLGKHPQDQFLPAFWNQNNNASNLIKGINTYYGTNQWVAGLIPGGGGGGGAPADAQYFALTNHGSLSAEIFPTNTPTATWQILNGTFGLNVPNLSGSNSGDVTLGGSPNYITISGQTITRNLIDLSTHVTGDLPFANLVQIPTARFTGRITGGTGDQEAMTGTQATSLLDVFTTSLKGLVPASPGGTNAYLRADITWATPPGGGANPAGTSSEVQFRSSGSAFQAHSSMYLTNSPDYRLVVGNLTVTTNAIFPSGTLTLGDADTNSWSFTAATNVTTDIFNIGPDAPGTGIFYGTISGTTNVMWSQLGVGSGLKLVGTNLTVGRTEYITFQSPSYGSGSGCLPITNNFTASGFGHWTFDGTSATNANYVRYETSVPAGIDTAGTVKLHCFKFSTGGTSTSQVNWRIGFGLVGDSEPRTPTIGNYVTFTVTPSSVSSGDVFQAYDTTLTGWAAAWVASRKLVVEIQRDGSDANNDSMTEDLLVLSYQTTQ